MKGKTIWSESMKLLKKRMLFYDDIAPGLLISGGAHIANLRQRKEPFYLPGGVPEDARLSAVIVSPSGFAKSFSMKQFMDPTIGFFPFPSAFRGKMTEAGFIGTMSDGEIVYGDAHRFRTGIIGFHEITNIFDASKQEHSAEMINQIMDCLSEGRVSKVLSTGPITYETNVTIWGGVQPKRFDFSAGLARRFLFIAKKWNYEDRLELMKHMIPKGKEDSDIFQETLSHATDLRERITNLARNFKPSIVRMTSDLEAWLMENATNHIQMSLMMRALIGYETMQCDESGMNGEMVLSLNDGTLNILNRILEMDNLVSEGADVALLITELEQRKNKTATQRELWDIFKAYSYSYSGFLNLLREVTDNMRLTKRTMTMSNEIAYTLRYRRNGKHDKKLQQDSHMHI